MKTAGSGFDDIPDFVVHNVLNPAEYTDRGVALTLVDAKGAFIRLHLKIVTAELLCERIAEALECRYGK
jgi:hypothetical protein